MVWRVVLPNSAICRWSHTGRYVAATYGLDAVYSFRFLSSSESEALVQTAQCLDSVGREQAGSAAADSSALGRMGFVCSFPGGGCGCQCQYCGEDARSTTHGVSEKQILAWQLEGNKLGASAGPLRLTLIPLQPPELPRGI